MGKQPEISRTEKDAVQYEQYGLRYPDGHIEWDHVKIGRSTYIQAQEVEQLAKGMYSTYLREGLEEHAQAASINVDDYISQHSFVKRTVVVAVTEPESIGTV